MFAIAKQKHMYKIATAISLILISFHGNAQNPIKINSKIYSPKQLHRDIDYALKKFESIHPNFYKETSKTIVKERFNLLKAKITKPMARFDFMNLFMPVAFNNIHDGHNYTFSLEEEFKSYIQSGGKLFPVPVIIKNRKLYCNSIKSDVPYNAKIVQVNNKPAKEIIEAVLSGYSNESDVLEEAMFSDWFNGSYWQTFGGFDAYKIEYFAPGSLTKKTIVIPGLSETQIESIRVKVNKADYEFEEQPALKTGVFKFNSAEGDLKVLRKFCDSVFNIIKQKEYTNLVIDIRNNPGGTTRANNIIFEYITDKPVSQFDSIETRISRERKAAFIRGNKKYAGWFKWYHYLYYPIYIRTNKERKQIMTAKTGSFITEKVPAMKPADNPLKFKGKLYLLTSARTYSAATGMAVAFKCYKLGPVIGQETGQPLVSTADWADFTLPNTKIRCAASVSRFTWACGKDDGHGVIPDHIIKPGNSDKDNEMVFVLEMIKNEK
ncbi:MAG: hypothetical protein EOP47_19055 [Sphingobacteriaceae bacterium]|nr:MAG: hypothetical protein EOP47_19055 [Sphingobacteriaceae bacterium]